RHACLSAHGPGMDPRKTLVSIRPEPIGFLWWMPMSGCPTDCDGKLRRYWPLHRPRRSEVMRFPGGTFFTGNGFKAAGSIRITSFGCFEKTPGGTTMYDCTK